MLEVKLKEQLKENHQMKMNILLHSVMQGKEKLEDLNLEDLRDLCVFIDNNLEKLKAKYAETNADVLDPAIKGTLNVLNSCKKFPSVRRVVLTSSMSAVVFTGKPRAPEVVVDETWFSDPEFCKESSMVWYTLSKTLAEDAAWKFAKENGLDMISMNPGMVIGPLLQPGLNSSVTPIFNLINGAKTYPNATFGYVNVKDVATAHILAFEVPSASGRYVLVETVVHNSEIAKNLQELYPILALPDRCADDKPFVPLYQVSKEKVKSLGIHYIPLEVSLKETVESLKEKEFVKFGSVEG